MDRTYKIQVLEAVRAGLPLKTAMKADKFSVLFPCQNYFTTLIEGNGERISIKEAELLLKHFPEKIFISNIEGIVFDRE